MIFVYGEFLLLIIYTIYLIQTYSDKDVKLYVKTLVFITYVTCFINVTLLPLDIYYTLRDENYKINKQNDENYQFLFQTWRLIYWTQFILTWIIIPLVQEYEDAGEFSHQEKVKKSIYINSLFYGIMVFIGLIFISFLQFTGIIAQTGLVAYLVALANCIGVILFITLLGHGLVTIPRNWLKKCDYQYRLKYLQYLAVQYKENLKENEDNLENLLKTVIVINRNYSLEIQNMSQIILKSLPQKSIDRAEKSITMQDQNDILKFIGVVKQDDLIVYNKKVKKQVQEVSRAETRLDTLVDEFMHMEDVKDSQFSYNQKFQQTFWTQRQGIYGDILNKLVWMWYVKLKFYTMYIIGVLLSLFSITLIYNEFYINDQYEYNSLKGWLQLESGYILIQIVCVVPLTYIAFCVFYGLFKLKITGYGIYPNKQTDAPSLLFSAINFSRVSSPLAFNFLQLFRIKQTAFQQLMGEVNLVPALGTSFPQYFPFLLLITCVISFFDSNIFSTQKNYNSLKSHDFEDGRLILQKARIEKERRYLYLNSTNLSQYNSYNNEYQQLTTRQIDTLI